MPESESQSTQTVVEVDKQTDDTPALTDEAREQEEEEEANGQRIIRQLLGEIAIEPRTTHTTYEMRFVDLKYRTAFLCTATREFLLCGGAEVLFPLFLLTSSKEVSWSNCI